VAIFYGINVIWERDLGIVQKFLASPTPRAALVLARASPQVSALSRRQPSFTSLAAARGEAELEPACAPQRAGHRGPGRDTVLDVFAHHRVHCEDAERFMGVARCSPCRCSCEQRDLPHRHYAGWLKTVSHLNPLTYVVDALRTFMLAGSASTFGLGMDYAVILLTTTSWSSLAPMYPVWHVERDLVECDLEMESTIQSLLASGKGILAADESFRPLEEIQGAWYSVHRGEPPGLS